MCHQISKNICGFSEKFLLPACQAACWSSPYASCGYCTIAEASELKQHCLAQLGSTQSSEICLQVNVNTQEVPTVLMYVWTIAQRRRRGFCHNKFLQCTASHHLPPSLSASRQNPFSTGILQLKETKVALACSACILGLPLQERGAWAHLFRHDNSKKINKCFEASDGQCAQSTGYC